MIVGASHPIHANHRALQLALGSVLVLLLLRSSALFAAWCDDLTAHGAYPTLDQGAVESSAGSVHQHHQHCEAGFGSGAMVALPVPLGAESDNLDPPLTQRDSLKRPIVKAPDDVAMPTGTVHNVTSPPLYLMFQRMLLPFHS